MLSLTLEAHEEDEWLGENPSPAIFPAGSVYRPLYHQWLTCHAERPLIINAYNTGTGKTKAAFLRLQQRAEAKQGLLDSSEDNVLLIAPTNELLAQHARDAKEFCERTHLPYRVLMMSRAALDEIEQRPGFSEGKLRPGAALHALMEDPRRTENVGQSEKQATLFVVNPDIFYYAFYFRYGRYDRIPLFQDILTLCNYIIIDEFHYYNPKQLANFLFFMHLSKWSGFVDGSTRRQFCLLTATPSKRVDEYLHKLQIAIDRIDPATVASVPAGLTRKVWALAPVQLEVYSTDELRGSDQGEASGLIALVGQKQREIARWLANQEDGAIISSSLWRIEQIYQRLLRLRPTLSTTQVGRITGPEKRAGRDAAIHKPLILATPTVDIGYNFDRQNKLRQNIDFLFFDARSGDEFVQRLGRAGRVLGKPEQTRPSRVYAVVDPAFYQALQAYDGQRLSRARLRELAEEVLPPRNDLYAYMESGSVAEAFLPLYQMKTMASSAQEGEIRTLFDSVQALFGDKAGLTYPQLCGYMSHFLLCQQHYRNIETLSTDQLDLLERVIVRRERHSIAWLQGFAARLQEEQVRRQQAQEPGWQRPQEAYTWVLADLQRYLIEKARFSFRESFQPPRALISDPRGLYTSDPVVCDDALRIIRFYHARYFRSREEWEYHVGRTAPEEAKDALVFCHLYALREPNKALRLGLKLDAGVYLRAEWEQIHASRLTALRGLELVALNTNYGLPPDIQFLLSERFIPALVVAQQSRASRDMWRLQKKAQYMPSQLRVTFGDDEAVDYWVVLGTMALQVEAELHQSFGKKKGAQQQ